MTHERFATLVVQIWKLRARHEKAEAKAQKDGLSNRLRSNRNALERSKVIRQLKTAALELVLGD